MKHSKLWLTLILIGLGLLLSGASDSVPSSKHPSTTPTTKAGNKHPTTNQISTPAEKPGSETATKHREPDTYNYYGRFNYIPESSAAQSSSITAAQVTAVLVALFTGALVVTSWLQWKAIRHQADIAERTHMETSRPWVSVNITVISDGLRFDPGGAQITVGGAFKNTGHSPAMDTRVYMKLALYSGGESPVDIQTTYINQIRSMSDKVGNNWGITIFPNGDAEKFETLRVTRAEIDRCRRGPTGTILPVVVGFIEYRFPFGDKRRLHYTRFIYEMAVNRAGRMGTPNADSDIPRDQLLFFASPLGGHESD